MNTAEKFRASQLELALSDYLLYLSGKVKTYREALIQMVHNGLKGTDSYTKMESHLLEAKANLDMLSSLVLASRAKATDLAFIAQHPNRPRA